MPGSEDSVSWWRFQNGLWDNLTAVIAKSNLEDIVVKVIKQLLKCKDNQLPKFVADGKLPAAVVPYLQSKLFDATLLESMDGPSSRFFLLFSDGILLDRRTHHVSPSTLDKYISKHCGYPYPAAEIEAIQNRLTAQGLDLCDILRRAVLAETLHEGDFERLPNTLNLELDRVAATKGMEILKVAHASFENWAVTFCRAGKLEAARVFAERLEVFAIDNGVGSAGKTFLQSVSECTLGNYSIQIKEELITKDPPSAESPQPALLALRGCRGFSTPELERTKKIRASWMKKLADPATIWSARPPYGIREVKFHLYGLFSMSSNNGVDFSRVDSGVARRCVGCPYKFKFCADPAPGTNERRWLVDGNGDQVDIKERDWLLPGVPGWLVWLLAVHKVCFQESQRGIGTLPLCMKEESEALMVTEVTEIIRQFLTDNCKVCDGSVAMTKTTLLRTLRNDQILKEYSVEQITIGVEQICEFSTVRGRRNLVVFGGSFVTL